MFTLALALFWPLLQMGGGMKQIPPNTPKAPYKEISSRWDAPGVIETGLSKIAFVCVCPSDAPDAGQLIVADSTGQLVEMRYGDDSGWTKVRSFGVGQPITAACAGAPHLDRQWRMYVGTRSGKIIELTRGDLGWTTAEVREIIGPVKQIIATAPGNVWVSQLFAIDADGRVVNLWLSADDQWVTRLIPEVDGGAAEVCFDIDGNGVIAIVGGANGSIYKFLQDSTGHWDGDVWAKMPTGPLDMASSADPTHADIAVYYSGNDGIFRYLFKGTTNDEKARIPIAGAVTNLIGKGDQRRFNEFYGVSAGDFCNFEFNYTTRQWDRIAMAHMPTRVVSTTFGPGREEPLHQIFVATADGKIYEFTRGYVEPDPDDEP